MRQSTTAPLIGWSRAFPATAEQVREARRFLAGTLGGCPAAGDAIVCLSELATNACLHSRSREPGGHFRVRVQRHGTYLRVEVRDQGGPWLASPSHDGLTGRGLLVVARLARDWGRTGGPQGGWTVWFEIGAP